ncbi:uncharacterized protein LOC144861775 isoform X1 [Branchiostoma floridae x Branchiostoma japonicum]
MYAFRSTSRLFMSSRGGPTLASLIYKGRFCQASALNGAALQLVETRVDWASQLTAHPARIRGRKWLPGSHSPKFPEFLAPPKDGYVHVFTPVEKVDCSPEECAPAMQQVIRNVLERRKEGALLFRGLPLATAEDFSRALVNLGLKLTSYKGGGGIRHQLAEAVDTASDEPPEFCIEPHHDLAYTNHYPEKIMFFCIDPLPRVQGERRYWPMCGTFCRVWTKMWWRNSGSLESCTYTIFLLAVLAYTTVDNRPSKWRISLM